MTKPIVSKLCPRCGEPDFKYCRCAKPPQAQPVTGDAVEQTTTALAVKLKAAHVSQPHNLGGRVNTLTGEVTRNCDLCNFTDRQWYAVALELATLAAENAGLKLQIAEYDWMEEYLERRDVEGVLNAVKSAAKEVTDLQARLAVAQDAVVVERARLQAIENVMLRPPIGILTEYAAWYHELLEAAEARKQLAGAAKAE